MKPRCFEIQRVGCISRNVDGRAEVTLRGRFDFPLDVLAVFSRRVRFPDALQSVGVVLSGLLERARFARIRT